MRLAIDARSLSTRPTGVGQYLMAAVNVWSVQRPDWQFDLLSHRPLHAAAQALLSWHANVRFQQVPAPQFVGNGLWWLLTQFERTARSLGADALWGASGLLPRWRRLPALLTVHDLVYLSLPGTMSWRSRIAYSLLAGPAIRQADWLWCVSSFTARELQRHYPERRNKALVMGSGLNPMRAAPPCLEEIHAVRLRYSLGERSLLFVGTLEPRKNLRFLLRLMPRLAAQGYQLVVVGCAGWGKTDLASELQAPGFPRHAVQFCDYVPDAELQSLYRAVSLFVSPSVMEGFGLPQLEALAAGLPVVAADNSAMPEVVGDAGLLVAGWDENAWLAAIEHAWQERSRFGEAGPIQAARHGLDGPCAELSRQMPAMAAQV